MLAFTGDNATLKSNSQPKLSSVHLPCVSSATTNDEAPLFEDINNNGDNSDVDDVEDEEDPLAKDGDNINDDIDDGVDELAELSEEEQDKVLEETAAVKHTITKVSCINLSHLQYLTTSSLGLTTCIHNHPLHNHCIAGMAEHLQRKTPQAKSNSLGC